MKHLKIKATKALEAYKQASNTNKQFLATLLGEEHFITDIKQRVTDYSSACKVLNRKECTLDHFAFLGTSQAKRQFARHKIATVIEAINQGWTPDWDNDNQYKYYNYFYNKKNGFSSVVGAYVLGCDVGSDLLLENREKAEYVAKICKEDFIIYLF